MQSSWFTTSHVVGGLRAKGAGMTFWPAAGPLRAVARSSAWRLSALARSQLNKPFSHGLPARTAAAVLHTSGPAA